MSEILAQVRMILGAHPEARAEDLEVIARKHHAHPAVACLVRLIVHHEGKKYDCNICGGVVDLTNAKRPTVHIGPGRKPSA